MPLDHPGLTVIAGRAAGGVADADGDTEHVGHRILVEIDDDEGPDAEHCGIADCTEPIARLQMLGQAKDPDKVKIGEAKSVYDQRAIAAYQSATKVLTAQNAATMYLDHAMDPTFAVPETRDITINANSPNGIGSFSYTVQVPADEPQFH